jgi:glutaredoxin-like protein
MPLLDENTKKEVGNFLKGMEGRTKMVYFDGGDGCAYCNDISTLLDDIKEVGNKVDVEKHLLSDRAAAEKYGADRAPLIIFEGKNRGKVRFYGIPSGHEFGGFLATIVEVSKGETVEFPEDLKKRIAEIDVPLRLDVFVTPQCPYCPGAVRLAHAMAILNKNVTGCGVEAVEFSEWADRSGVRHVPRTIVIVNGKPVDGFEGTLAPDMLLTRILGALE